MRLNVVATALVGCLALVACQVNQEDHITAAKASAERSQADVASDAQKRAVKICRYVPTTKTILEILDLGIPNISKAAAIAEEICKAVSEGQKGGSVPRVHGVRVRGKFL